MRTTNLIIFITAAILFASCNAKSKVMPPVLPTGTYCYEYNLSFDTIRVHLEIDGRDVNGTMSYLFNEMSNNTGELRGTMDGSLIMTEFTEHQNDQTLVSQMYFLLEDAELHIGFGEMEQSNGILIYKDTSAIHYDTYILRPSDCK